MKYLIAVITFAASVSAQANWMRVSDFEAGLVRGFQLEKDCKAGGEACAEIDPSALAYSKAATTVVDGEIVPAFVIDEAKKAAFDAEQADKQAKRDAKKARLEQLRNLQLQGNPTNAQLAVVVRALLEELKDRAE